MQGFYNGKTGEFVKDKKKKHYKTSEKNKYRIDQFYS